jgi:hypothetical protein
LRNHRLGVFFVVFVHRKGRRHEDRVVEDRRVVAFGGRAELGVDDRVDQEAEDAAAAAGSRGRPGVVDQFCAFGFEDPTFLEEFDFPK